MPAKNAGKHIAATIESIISQSCTDWELLIVNDHSTDDTSDISRSYASRDTRIQLLENKGKGIIDALNTGLEQSSGDLISRMDADDLMRSEKLEKMQKAISHNPKAIITSYVEYFSDTSLMDGFIQYEKWLNRLIDEQSHFQNIYKECVIASPNWLMNKGQFLEIGGFGNTVYPEDYDLCFRMYRNNIEVVGIKEKLHLWRDHPERASRNDDNYQDNAFLDLKLNHFLEHDFSPHRDLYVWGAGKKGKRLAKKLNSNQIPFHWVTNNERKIGHQIHGAELMAIPEFSQVEAGQFLILVAGPDDQKEIIKEIEDQQQHEFYWFC